jgi:hypothetical protein
MTTTTVTKPATVDPLRGARLASASPVVPGAASPLVSSLDRSAAATLGRLVALIVAIGMTCALLVAGIAGGAALVISRAMP